MEVTDRNKLHDVFTQDEDSHVYSTDTAKAPLVGLLPTDTPSQFTMMDKATPDNPPKNAIYGLVGVQRRRHNVSDCGKIMTQSLCGLPEALLPKRSPEFLCSFSQLLYLTLYSH
jgi:hypothetical protein